MRTRLTILLAGSALAVVIAPPALADRLVAASRSVPVDSLSAYHGLLVWGGSDTESNRGAYFASRGGAVTRLRVRAPTGGGLGTIDLGSGHRGGTVAVFERCGVVDEGETGWSSCDIYRYGFGTRRASRLLGASTQRYEERAPSIWRGRVVLARSNPYWYDEIFRGPHLGLFVTAPFTGLSRPKVEIPETDLRGHTVAFLTLSDQYVMKLWVKRFDRRGRGRSCRIASGEGGVAGEPKLDGGYVYWGRTTGTAAGTPSTSIHRRRLPGRDCRSRGPEQVASQTIPLRTDQAFTFAVDGGRVFYATTTYPTEGSIRGDIWEMQPIQFVDR